MPTSPEPVASTDFATALLTELGLPVSKTNVLFLHIWMQAEGGSQAADRNNPLNTHMDAPGATTNPNGTKNYPTLEMGVWATAQTLRLPAYAPILSALRVSDMHTAANAVVHSPWGTLPHPLLDLVQDTGGDAVGEGVVQSTADLALAPDAAAADATRKVLGWTGALAGVLNHLLDPRFWARIGQGAAAAALLLIALGLIFRKQIARVGAAAATDGLSEAA